jgi:hypothetical protein
LGRLELAAGTAKSNFHAAPEDLSAADSRFMLGLIFKTVTATVK